jgi:hypothetical protein
VDNAYIIQARQGGGKRGRPDVQKLQRKLAPRPVLVAVVSKELEDD